MLFAAVPQRLQRQPGFAFSGAILDEAAGESAAHPSAIEGDRPRRRYTKYKA
jgi:hypothetical protein